jgi:hypothetical protein
MTAQSTLTMIRLAHTAIWVFFNVVIFYLFHTVSTGRIDHWTWICLALIVIEAVVLVAFNRICPITLIARKYSSSTRANFDILLPEWLARNNQLIYSIIVAATIILLIYRLITGYVHY